MKASELREKSAEELQDILETLLQDQFKLRMQRTTGELSATHEIKLARRGIARVRTVLHQKRGKANG